MPLELDIGQVLRFDCAWQYQGPAVPSVDDKPRIRCSIGQKVVGIFDELLYTDTALILPVTSVWEDFSQTLVITTTTKLVRGRDYHLEVKIYEGAHIYAIWRQDNAIRIIIVAPPADFKNLEVTISKG